MGKNGILIKNPDKIKITVELEKLMTNNNLRKCLEKSSWSNFTAYHPIWNSGVYLRYQYGMLMMSSDKTSRLYDLDNSHTLSVGWKGQFRFPEERPR